LKIRLTFLLLFVIAFTKSNGQDTIYLKSDLDTIRTSKERALYYKIVQKDSLLYNVSIYHTNGKIISKAQYRSLDSLIYHGSYTSYFYNGNIHISGQYINGSMEGWWVAYNKDKYYLKTKQSFKNNLLNGKSFTIYPNGKPKIIELYIRDTLTQINCYDSMGVQVDCDSLLAFESDSAGIIDHAEVPPSFPGGPVELLKYLAKNVKYPQQAREKGFEGIVKVKFFIDTDGTVKNPTIIKDGVGGGAAQEALRVVNSMPKWTPGVQMGKTVKVYYTIPIIFKLQ
jgi:TonB family protein